MNVLQVRTLQLDGVNPQALDFVNLKLTGANNLTSTMSFRPKARTECHYSLSTDHHDAVLMGMADLCECHGGLLLYYPHKGVRCIAAGF